MTSNQSQPSPLLNAIAFLKQGRVQDARNSIGISPAELSDTDFVNCLSAIDSALRLTTNGRFDEALPYLKASMSLVDKTNDQETKVVIPILYLFSEGVTKLHAGDAHGALKSLETVSNVAEKLSIFSPEMRRFALSSKLGAFVALGRASLSTGDLPSAEKWFGRAEDALQEMSTLLDPANPNDLKGYVEVYGTPLEFSSMMSFYDLQILDTSKAMERLSLTTNHLSKLKEFTGKLPAGPLRDIAEVSIILNSSLRVIVPFAEKVIFSDSFVTKKELEKVRNELQYLTQGRELAKRAGSRGAGYIWITEALRKFTRNLIAASGSGKREFGRFGGLISFGAFVITMGLITFTIKPSAAYGLWYFLGALILSLIVGFGFSALKFIPLLNLYRKAIKDSPND